MNIIIFCLFPLFKYSHKLNIQKGSSSVYQETMVTRFYNFPPLKTTYKECYIIIMKYTRFTVQVYNYIVFCVINNKDRFWYARCNKLSVYPNAI